MSHVLRRLLSLALALAFSFASLRAYADAAAPVDVPTESVTQATIPPLPASYVTKSLGWLELSYPKEAAERVAPLLEDAQNVKTSLAAMLGQPVLEHVTVRVAPSAAAMAALAPAEIPPPRYASGVAYHGLHLVLLSMMEPRGAEAVDLDEVFRHELAHVALEDAVIGKHVPVWFNEGLAIALSGEPTWARRGALWQATLSGTLIPVADLDRNFPNDGAQVGIAYAESADFVGFLSRKADARRFASLIARVRDGQSFERAVAESYGAELRRLEFEWRGALDRRFTIIPMLTGGGLVWAVGIGLFGLAYVRRRRRSKAILARWEREEALEDARIAARLAAERDEHEVMVRRVASVVPLKIEHEGDWHTLH